MEEIQDPQEMPSINVRHTMYKYNMLSQGPHKHQASENLRIISGSFGERRFLAQQKSESVTPKLRTSKNVQKRVPMLWKRPPKELSSENALSHLRRVMTHLLHSFTLSIQSRYRFPNGKISHACSGLMSLQPFWRA